MGLKDLLKEKASDIVEKGMVWAMKRLPYDSSKDDKYQNGEFSRADNAEFLETMVHQFESWKYSGVSKSQARAGLKTGVQMSMYDAEGFLLFALSSKAKSYAELIHYFEDESKYDPLKNESESALTGGLASLFPPPEKSEIDLAIKDDLKLAFLLRQYLSNQGIDY